MLQAPSLRLALCSLAAVAIAAGCGSGGDDTNIPITPGTGGSAGSTVAGGTSGTSGAGVGGAVAGVGGSLGGSGAGIGGANGGSFTGGAAGTSGASGSFGTGGAGAAGFGAGGTSGGSAGAGAGSGSGGLGGSGAGAGGMAGGATGDCNFSVMSQTADKAGNGGIPTVGIVTWSVDLTGLTMANIEFGLPGGTPMTAPIDVASGPNFRTLLLGMKGSKTYSFHVNVSNGTKTCKSSDYMITTGAVPSSVPRTTRTAGTAASSQAKGFITMTSQVTSMSTGQSMVWILDADGDAVWWTTGPTQCSRAKMSYDGQYMWMATLNVQNTAANGGGVDRISMDGLKRDTKVNGFSNCHHDLTILPDGKIACLSWIAQTGDQPSDIIEGDTTGFTKVARLDAAVYPGGASAFGGGGDKYHANSIHYHQKDNTYTVSDRNPNLFVKVSRTGQVIWQFGGTCTGVPATKCASGNWQVNHGHDFLDDGSGTFLFFNNGASGASTAFKYTINESGTFSANMVWSYKPGTSSNVLGDIQQLPNGNTLITFSTASLIHEINPQQQLVQSISGGVGGYAEWRETMYGPPPRF